jgi:hypothetical protein
MSTTALTRAFFGGQAVQQIPVTSATYTCDSASNGLGDYLVLCNLAGAVGITLPPVLPGRVIKVKDASGAAGTNHITITPASGDIDGAATYVLSLNYAAVELISDGTNWWVTGSYNGTVI